MSNGEALTPIEEALKTYYAIEPNPTFISRLEAELLSRPHPDSRLQVESTPVSPGSWPDWLKSFYRPQWAIATLAGLLVLIVAVLALRGPQQVLAQIQQLLGYVPGIGFVDLDESRLLAAPVEVNREGITLRVEQVVAQPDQTTVVIRSEGLKPESSDGINRAVSLEYGAQLHLPDGRVMSSERQTLRRGAGIYEFPPLPAEAYRLTFALSRLPLVLPGAAPEDWQVPLELQPATGELVTDLFPRPYTPDRASNTHHDISLEVSGVAHGFEETLINLQVHWIDPDWRLSRIGFSRSPDLQDDLGHRYSEVTPSTIGQSVRYGLPPPPPPPAGSSTIQTESNVEVVQDMEDKERGPAASPAIPTGEVTLAFAPLSPSARHLTLVVVDIEFEVPVEEQFTVDLGENPQVGDTWPLDIDLQVAGFPVHISEMRLIREEFQVGGETSLRQSSLEFVIDPVPVRNNRFLTGLRLDGRSAGFSGSGSGYSLITGQMEASIDLDEGQTIPTGQIHVRVQSAAVVFEGPWMLSWQISRAKETASGVTPIILYSSPDSQTRHGVTLQTGPVTLTDRLTQLTIQAGDLPAGAAFAGAPYRPPGPGFQGWSLLDDRGRRYEWTNFVRWQPPGREREDMTNSPRYPGTLRQFTFEPVDSLARRLTLEVPAVVLLLPADDAAFEITVPEGVSLNPSLALPRRSEAWPVDIPVEAGTYHLRFTQAQLQELNGTILLTLTSAPFEGQQGVRRLVGLALASVADPAGRNVNLKTAHSDAGSRQNEAEYRAHLSFAVADPATHRIQSGRYRVELDGLLILVEGPWTLSWDLNR